MGEILPDDAQARFNRGIERVFVIVGVLCVLAALLLSLTQCTAREPHTIAERATYCANVAQARADVAGLAIDDLERAALSAQIEAFALAGECAR